MSKRTLKSKGFGLIGLLIIIVVLVVAGGGAYVYLRNHKAKAPVSGKTNETAAWKTGSLKYERATFKYPSTWQISSTSRDETDTGGTVTPGSDVVVLTSPTGLKVQIDTGIAWANIVANSVLSTQAINTLGGRYSLDFYTYGSSSPSDAQAACVTTANTPGKEFGFVPSRYIKTTGSNVSAAHDAVCLEYEDAQGNEAAKPVSTFQQDKSYNDAKLIIESVAY
jgi:hypothetical protein